MKITLIENGKIKDRSLRELTEEYHKRIKHYINFEVITLADLKKTASLNEQQIKAKEGELMLKNFGKSDFIILLDENGKEYSSVQFAGQIQKIMNRGVHQISFVIGGPYGFSEEIYKKADQKISLSRMTFSHQLIRLIFAEQLYRAFTILNNEPYHHQ